MKKKHKHREPQHPTLDLTSLAQARELFWQNVMREMLTSLSMQRSRLDARIESFADAEARGLAPPEAQPADPPTLEGFDGRMAIVTTQGERIPIADITPLFACSIGGTMRERALSEDVQCTVFQIRTPSGEVYTFPIQEIRGFHALSEEAMQALQNEAAEATGDGTISGAPFGFAAFTSLAHGLDDQEGAGEDDTAPAGPQTTGP